MEPMTPSEELLADSLEGMALQLQAAGLALEDHVKKFKAKRRPTPPPPPPDPTLDLSKSTLAVNPAIIQVGQSSALLLTLRDNTGAQLTAGGHGVSFTKGSGTSDGTLSAATDNANGTYGGSFTGTVAGTPRQIGATVDGQPITSTLPTIDVDDAPPPPPPNPTLDLSKSIVSVSPSDIRVGDTATLTVALKDTNGQPYTFTTPVVAFTQSGGSGVSAGTIGAVTNQGGGIFTATFTATTAGSPTTIGATADGQPVTSSLPTLTVRAVAIDRIAPGTGWTGPTAEPTGSGTQAIARWNLVPNQDVAGDLRVGIVAFHIGTDALRASGAGPLDMIDRVEVSAENGPWFPIRTMSLNPDSGTVEFHALLRASDFPRDGRIELRAIAYPKQGKPRLLEPLILFVDARNTLPKITRYVSTGGDDALGAGTAASPFRTIKKALRSIEQAGGGKADGGRVYLQIGNHILDNDGRTVRVDERWVHILPAPGLTRDEAKITHSASSTGARTRMLAIHTIQVPWLVGSGTSARIRNNLSTIPDAMLWVDNVHFKGHGRLAMDAADQDDFIKSRGEWGRRVYATNCLTEDCVNGLTALKYNRGSTSRKIIADHFQNSEMLVDCIAEDTDRSGTSAHGDVYQLTTFRLVNGIYYNVNSSDLIKSGQGLYYSNDRNDLTKYPTSDGLPNTLVNGLAIVNVRVQLLYGSTASWSFFAQCPFENVLVAGGSIKGGRNAPYGPVWQDGFEGKDVVVYRNVFPEATDLRDADGVTYV